MIPAKIAGAIILGVPLIVLALVGLRRQPRPVFWFALVLIVVGLGYLMALPAYDQCIKASHIFNLLDARGVISVTERQSYILRVRELAKACGAAWLKTAGGGAN